MLNEAKKEALKKLMGMVKKIRLEGIEVEKPDKSPEHEAQKSPEVEEAELGEPMDEIDENKEPDKPDHELDLPFTSDEERIKRNKYKGGNYKAILAGVISSNKSKSPKGK